MKSYIVYLAADHDVIESVIYLNVSGEKHIIWVRALKYYWGLPTQLIIFLDFWAKILQIARPVDYSYLPPCLDSVGKLHLEYVN